TWVGAFGGFAPGFTYCVPEELIRRRRPRRSQLIEPVPRLESPRTRVPAGAVAVAAEFSAAYPRSSPGGWQLIGTTDAPLWDTQRAEPALIRPGDQVRYIAQQESISVTHPGPSAEAAVPVAHPALEVTAAGARTLAQDIG